MAAVTSLGAGSGIDLQGLLDNLMKIERQPIDTLNAKIASYNTKISALGTMSSKLSALQTAAKALKPATLQTPMEAFATYSGRLEDDKLGKVTVGTGAVTGNYRLDIVSVAQGQKTNIRAADMAMGGTLGVDLGDPSKDFTVNVTAGASLNDVANAINQKKSGVSATVVNGSGGQELILSGENGKAFTVGGFTSATSQAASQAEVKIDGVSVVSDSNKFSDIITGVTLDISGTAAGNSTTLSVTKDSEEKLKSSLEAFVKAFNDAASTMGSLGSYNIETKVAGALQGNSLLRETQNTLSKLVSGTKLDGMSLSSIGISIKGTDGALALDAEKLKAAVAANPEAVAKFAAEVGKVFERSLNDIAGVGGRIQTSKDSFNATIRSQESRREALEKRMESIEQRYRSQFTALDTLVSKMNSTSNWLAQNLSSLSPQR
jgi:flagellar hook-associated protein 2